VKVERHNWLNNLSEQGFYFDIICYVGILEFWNDGMLGDEKKYIEYIESRVNCHKSIITHSSILPFFHFSIHPSYHYIIIYLGAAGSSYVTNMYDADTLLAAYIKLPSVRRFIMPFKRFLNRLLA
jgi:hypothetical protein